MREKKSGKIQSVSGEKKSGAKRSRTLSLTLSFSLYVTSPEYAPYLSELCASLSCQGMAARSAMLLIGTKKKKEKKMKDSMD
jgi:hypothetical protein